MKRIIFFVIFMVSLSVFSQNWIVPADTTITPNLKLTAIPAPSGATKTLILDDKGGVGSVETSVTSIADLRDVTDQTGKDIELLGYYSKDDGGGGQFYWDDTATSADNGGTIIKLTTTTTGRYKRTVTGEEINAKWFGCVPDIQGDSIRDALQDAINYASNNKFRFIKVPTGVYYINNPIYFCYHPTLNPDFKQEIVSGRMVIKGSGNGYPIDPLYSELVEGDADANTTLKFTGSSDSSGIVIGFNATYKADICGLEDLFVVGTKNAGVALIHMGRSPNAVFKNVNVYSDGEGYGIYMNANYFTVFENVKVYGDPRIADGSRVGYGIYMENGAVGLTSFYDVYIANFQYGLYHDERGGIFDSRTDATGIYNSGMGNNDYNLTLKGSKNVSFFNIYTELPYTDGYNVKIYYGANNINFYGGYFSSHGGVYTEEIVLGDSLGTTAEKNYWNINFDGVRFINANPFLRLHGGNDSINNIKIDMCQFRGQNQATYNAIIVDSAVAYKLNVNYPDFQYFDSFSKDTTAIVYYNYSGVKIDASPLVNGVNEDGDFRHDYLKVDDNGISLKGSIVVDSIENVLTNTSTSLPTCKAVDDAITGRTPNTLNEVTNTGNTTNNNIEVGTVTLGTNDNIIVTTTNRGMKASTLDTGDTLAIKLTGGGEPSNSRGALIALYGNENTDVGVGGDVLLNAGAVSGAMVSLDNSTLVVVDGDVGIKTTTPSVELDVVGDVLVSGTIGNTTQQTSTLGVGATTIAITTNVITLTGDGGANVLGTITGGEVGLYTFIFVDGLITITDTDAHTANTVDLAGTATDFTSADDSVLSLVYDGTSWYEVSRSVN